MANLIPQPGVDPVDRQDAQTGTLLEVNAGWRNFFVAIYNILNALTLSGTTAQRPTKFLWVGRPYFDTTLGITIFVSAIGPPAVWVAPATSGLPAGGTTGQIVLVDGANVPRWSVTTWPNSLDTSGVLHQGIAADQVITRQSLTFNSAVLKVAAGYAGNDMEMHVENVDITSGTARAVLSATAGGTGGGDALTKWVLPGLQTWAAGADISAANAWKLSASGTLGTTDIIAATPAGALTIVTPPAYAAGDLYLVMDAAGHIHLSTLGPGA